MRTEIRDVGERRWRASAVTGAAGGLLLLLLVTLGGCAGDTGDDASARRAGVDGDSGTAAGTTTVAIAQPSVGGSGGEPSSAGGGKDSAGNASLPAGAPTVLIAGTSLTAGLGLDPADAYPAILQRLADSAGLPARVINGGSSGETSAGLVRRIDWLLREPADVVVIETGANDGLRGVDPAVTAANLRQIVKAVSQRLPRARVLLVQMEAPPNLGTSYTSRFRSMYADVARESGATLVPFLLEGVAGVSSLNQADGIHPNEEGARVVAHTVWTVLGPLLAEVDRSGSMR